MPSTHPLAFEEFFAGIRGLKRRIRWLIYDELPAGWGVRRRVRVAIRAAEVAQQAYVAVLNETTPPFWEELWQKRQADDSQRTGALVAAYDAFQANTSLRFRKELAEQLKLCGIRNSTVSKVLQAVRAAVDACRGDPVETPSRPVGSSPHPESHLDIVVGEVLITEGLRRLTAAKLIHHLRIHLSLPSASPRAVEQRLRDAGL